MTNITIVRFIGDKNSYESEVTIKEACKDADDFNYGRGAYWHPDISVTYFRGDEYVKPVFNTQDKCIGFK